MTARTILPAFVLAFGCTRSSGDFWLVLGTEPGSGVRLSAAVVSPADALVERRADPRGVALRLRSDRGPLRVSAPGGCPLVVEAPGQTVGFVERRVEPLFDLGPKARVVGPEQRFEIRAFERCDEAKSSRLEFRIPSDAPLDDVRIENGGRTLSAKTRGLDRLRRRPAWGIVPVSAARRSMTEITARATFPKGEPLERTIEVSALSRSSGLSSIAEGHPVLLAGSGFRLQKKPEGSRAGLRPVGELTELVPDVRGDFELADGVGRKLVIQSGRYDEMPLDCGRSDCHAVIAASVGSNLMTRVLEADLGGRHSLERPECALACHATGEPGTNDGGFSHVMGELGLATLPHDFAELPRALRRLGGVGCLACHGPARVPPDDAKWAVLRSDVCAVCHDAPPRYGHVAAFETTNMAFADRDPRTRERPECARCHTTWGSLGEPERRPPAHVGALGLGCAACHDIHGKSGSSAQAAPNGPRPALLRNSDVRAALPGAPKAADGASRVCIGCHAPGSAPLPEASAAAIWAGLGGVDPKTGEALEGPAKHAQNSLDASRGCLTCHDSGPATLERGARHAFEAGPKSCVPCHREPPERRPELAAEARALVDELLPPAGRRASSGPPHAEPLVTALSPAKSRALKNALLVLEDPAADVHNFGYARRLLDVSLRSLGRNPQKSPAEARP